MPREYRLLKSERDGELCEQPRGVSGGWGRQPRVPDPHRALSRLRFQVPTLHINFQFRREYRTTFREPLHYIIMSIMVVTVLTCTDISDRSLPGGSHRCHRHHQLLEGVSTYGGDTRESLVVCVCGVD
jgi:hypothetical protein